MGQQWACGINESEESHAMTKTMSFAVVHFTVAFSVGYAVTGSVLVGGTLALVEPAINTLAYHLREKVWARSDRTGRRAAAIWRYA
jgi:uncharacterized membrane protein